VLGSILELIFRNGIGTATASSTGFVTLLIAHHLSGDGDTMEMMRAVLDSNFWLATHVVVITLGYASTFLAGALALIYVLRKYFFGELDEATGKNLAGMVYGIVCFATLFSFVGTTAPSSAASGPTSLGADSGAGIRRKTARCSS
jgi:hypothetical protein